MADKMLRIAGRSADGLAKAISADEFGNQIVKDVFSETAFWTDSGTLAPGETYKMERRFSLRIKSIVLEFPVDNINEFVYRLNMYVPETDTFRQITFPYDTGVNTPFITPTTVLYDGLWETVVNEGRRVVRLRFPINVPGFRLEAMNRSTTSEYRFNLQVIAELREGQ